MKYEVIFRPAAERQLEKLEPAIIKRIKPAILALSTNPRPYGSLKIKGKKIDIASESGIFASSTPLKTIA